MTVTDLATMAYQTDQRYSDWLESLGDDPQPTHRMHLRISVAVDVVLPPWMSTGDGLQEVGKVANRLDVDEIMAHIDYQRDHFLPAGSTLKEIHGDAERLS